MKRRCTRRARIWHVFQQASQQLRVCYTHRLCTFYPSSPGARTNDETPNDSMWFLKTQTIWYLPVTPGTFNLNLADCDATSMASMKCILYAFIAARAGAGRCKRLCRPAATVERGRALMARLSRLFLFATLIRVVPSRPTLSCRRPCLGLGLLVAGTTHLRAEGVVISHHGKEPLWVRCPIGYFTVPGVTPLAVSMTIVSYPLSLAVSVIDYAYQGRPARNAPSWRYVVESLFDRNDETYFRQWRNIVLNLRDSEAVEAVEFIHQVCDNYIWDSLRILKQSRA